MEHFGLKVGGECIAKWLSHGYKEIILALNKLIPTTLF